jgi:hypothetical protein
LDSAAATEDVYPRAVLAIGLTMHSHI